MSVRRLENFYPLLPLSSFHVWVRKGLFFFLFHSTFQAHGTQACVISEIGAHTLMQICFRIHLFTALSFSRPNLVFIRCVTRDAAGV
jgi:hypothetical protein